MIMHSVLPLEDMKVIFLVLECVFFLIPLFHSVQLIVDFVLVRGGAVFEVSN